MAMNRSLHAAEKGLSALSCGILVLVSPMSVGQPQHSSCSTLSLVDALGEQQRHKHTLLFFQSSLCGLCKSIGGVVTEEHEKHKSNLNVVNISTDGAQGFAPEMLQYDIQSVPCFVLLKPGGLAVAKSGEPRSREHVTAALSKLLRLVPDSPAAKPSSN